MNLIKSGVFVAILFMASDSHASESTAFNAVQNLFAAMSSHNYQKMRGVGTDDFQLLEQGEVWDMEDLINAIKPMKDNGQRRNYFKVIKTVTKDDFVWVSYWNRADITWTDGRPQASWKWLESAFMVKENNVWKLQLLHSTGSGSAQGFPKDEDLKEYIN